MRGRRYWGLGAAAISLAIGACSVLKQASPESASLAASPTSGKMSLSGRAERQPVFNTEAYAHVNENPFLEAQRNPLSTFSIDVDTASYSNVRRFLREGQAPPPDAVRVEELINYFSYAYPEPQGAAPMAISTELSQAPWNPQHRLLQIGLQGKRIAKQDSPAKNIVMLIDVSGSMQDENKLPLLKQAMAQLVSGLSERDRIAMVVYAGASGLALPSTSAADRSTILSALAQLESGGSTNGAAGIQLAYQVARQHFVSGGVNRVILATDGDFNVGTTSEGELVRLIEKERESGVFLSVLGFGMGNYKDATLEKLADKGNGNYAYIDDLTEARKVLVEQAGSTLITIAKDVKIQVEFNPARVSSYRLIGYENRMLRAEDFKDDRKDAGEMGAGHSVTALYEIVPVGGTADVASVDALKYQKPAELSAEAKGSELLTVKVRYKEPEGSQSSLLTTEIQDAPRPLAETSESFRFAFAVASFGMSLRNSEHRGTASFSLARSLAKDAIGTDPHGHRQQFLALIGAAERLRIHQSR